MYYVVANICFNNYKEAYNYCMQCDFIPALMITEMYK